MEEVTFKYQPVNLGAKIITLYFFPDMSTEKDEDEKSIKFICPSAKDLGVIVNEVRCEECSLVFCNEPRFRLHYLKVHKRKSLDRTCKDNVRYNCPVENCIYAPNKEKSFKLHKYLKQVVNIIIFKIQSQSFDRDF